MTYAIAYNASDHIIELKVQGNLTLQGVKEFVYELVKVSKEQNCYSILNDMRQATIKLSTLEIYELPAILSDIAASSGLDIHKFRRAFVTQNEQDNLIFFENVSVNRSQNAKYFIDIDEARKWLIGK